MQKGILSGNRGRKLSAWDKVWLFKKIDSFFRADQYFSHLDRTLVSSEVRGAIEVSTNFEDLLAAVKKISLNKPIKFTRKLSATGNDHYYFEYPPLWFQLETLFLHWDTILSVYEELKSHDASIGYRFGHKPEPTSNRVIKSDRPSLRLIDANIAGPLKKPFFEEYSEFKNSICRNAKQLFEEGEKLERQRLVLAQTDIKKFFHTLKTKTLVRRLKEDFPILSDLVESTSEMNAFGYDTVPIGWAVSGTLVDLCMVGVHERFAKELQAKTLSRVEAIITQRLHSYIPAQGQPHNLETELLKTLRLSGLQYRASFNYVDDFVFLVTYLAPEDSTIAAIFDKVIGFAVVEAAEELLNLVLPNSSGGDGKRLEFYKSELEKLNILSFDRTNIETLQSNFIPMLNAKASFEADSDNNVWTRLDEFLLPVDNDLALNERSQFFSTLNNLRKSIIDGSFPDEATRDEIFRKIFVKIEGDGARYIRTILQLLEAMFAVAKRQEDRDYLVRKTVELVERYQTKPSLDLNLKLFSGLFNCYERFNFDLNIQFYIHLDNFAKAWFQKYKNEWDKLLLEDVRTTFRIRQVNHQQVEIGRKDELQDDVLRVAGSLVRGIAVGLNVLWAVRGRKIQKLRLANGEIDAVIASHVLSKSTSRDSEIDIDDYLTLTKQVAEQCGNNAAVLFFRLSCATILSRFSDADLKKAISYMKEEHGNSTEVQLLSESLKTVRKNQGHFEQQYSERLKFAYNGLKNGSWKELVPSMLLREDERSPFGLSFFFLSLCMPNRYFYLRAYLHVLGGFESILVVSGEFLPKSLFRVGTAFVDILDLIRNEPLKKGVLVSALGTIKKIRQILKKELQFYPSCTDPLEKFRRDDVVLIDIAGERYKRFYEQIKVRKEVRVTLASVNIPKSEFVEEAGLTFSDTFTNELDTKIQAAISEACKQKASIVVFPELTLPRRYLRRYLNDCAKNNLVLIAGVEYEITHPNKAKNVTIVSIPCSREENPFGYEYIGFEQPKRYPSAEENHSLKENGFEYVPGSTQYIFQISGFGRFAILTCSDFLSLRLRLKLQKEIQTLFVPAQTNDSTTYDHITQASIRELHCFTVVCNSPCQGSSFVYGPFYRDHERVVMKRVGRVVPEFCTVLFKPEELLASQRHPSLVPFRKDPKRIHPELTGLEKMKQTPPDWGTEEAD